MLPVDYFLFLQIAFFICITPGTPRVVIVTYAINYGLKRSIFTAIGDVSANALQMILVAFGVGALVSLYPNILNYLKWVGIFYLLYIAFNLFKHSKNCPLLHVPSPKNAAVHALLFSSLKTSFL